MAAYTLKLKEILREQGCYFERQGRGDHEIWYSPVTRRRFPVDQKILSRHTANAV
jgi:HicA-like toxin of HicAB toxin-antitoxin system